MAIYTFSLLFVAFFLKSCEGTPMGEKPNFSSKTPSTGDIIKVIEASAPIIVNKKMKSISPNTGRNPKYDYDVEDLIFDKASSIAKIPLTISWSSSDYLLSTKTDICEMQGELMIDLSNREDDIVTCIFRPKHINDWTKKVLRNDEDKIKKALNKISFDPYK